MDSYVIQQYYATLQIPSGSKSIRLLHVQAPVGGLDEPLRCDLSVADLDSKPQYTAISYVWGAMSPVPDTITCGGVNLPLTPNALSALHHLRAQIGAFAIWIDAICINQLDDGEKGQQIPLMGDIYGGAATTYIWLGEGSPARQRAIEYLSYAGFPQYYFRDSASMWDGGVCPRTWAASFVHCRRLWSFKDSSLPYDTTGTTATI